MAKINNYKQMNIYKVIQLLIIHSLLLIGIVSGQIHLTQKDDKVVIDNSLIKRVISISKVKGSPITSLFINKLNNSEIASTKNEWFSFSIDNKIVSSGNPVWIFTNVTIRELQNNGKEYTLEFSSINSELLVNIIIQTFENTKIYREKIVLLSNNNKELKLSKVDGRVFFEFGGLSYFTYSNANVNIEELRIASWNNKLIDTDYSSSYDNKILEKDWHIGRNLEQNYMYHPKRLFYNIDKEKTISVKGPFLIVSNRNKGFWISYEHGAPDDDIEQDYVSLNAMKNNNELFTNIILKDGAYYDGETLSKNNPFSSLWYVYSFYDGINFDEAESQIWDYLNFYICENPESRKPMFYYNTWGMQRDESKQGNDVREILTEEKVKEEIDNASQLGIDLFVLDDGWQDKFGDWNPNKKRFPNGLEFFVDRCNLKGIIPGIWLATIATDTDAEIAKKHPEWLIREDDKNLVVGRWDKNIFCFVSGYKDYFIDKCKVLIDKGICYFKWDGIDKHLCSSPLHQHGTDKQSAKERKKMQGFDIVLQVADAIKQLKDYQHDVIIEVDVTEAERSVGLAILSEARYFWMNNGASWYGDYSSYRAKSMRMITNLFGGFFPPVLQTYANFPINSPIYQAQHYNVNSSLIGGKGFWGNISKMTSESRKRVGKLVNKIKRVENDVTNVRPVIKGKVGSSPEIYEFINKEESTGKVIAFSGSTLKYDNIISEINPQKVLGILNNSYRITNDSLILKFEFYFPDDTKEAILLSNNDSGISVVSSTSWLDNIELNQNNSLSITNGAAGIHVIKWAKKNGTPKIKASKEIESKVDIVNENFIITIKTYESATSITLLGRQ